MALIFLITTLVFAIGWLKYKVSSRAMIYHIEKKGYKQPSDDEVAKCTREVVKHMFKLN